MTKLGKTILLAVERVVGTDDYLTIRLLSEAIEDADGDGVATLDRPGGVAERSAWVAVDLPSGEFDTAAPGGPARRGQFRGRGLHLGQGKHGIEEARPYFLAALVRPGSGAWGRLALDGSAQDADHIANGTTDFDIEDLEAIGSSGPTPATLQEKDLVVLVDTDTLEVVSVRVAAASQSLGGVR